MPISISRADKSRQKLTKDQQKRIKGLYSQVSKDIENQIAKLNTSTASGAMKSVYLDTLQKQINQAMEEVGKETEKYTIESMTKAAELIGEDINSWLSKYNVQIAENYSYVAQDVVQSIATGQLYEGDWTLSKAVWKNIEQNQNDINMIVAKGLAENKSVVGIAKDLANYTNPHKLTRWNLTAPDGKRVLRTSVDYNAQRLVRTMTSHAYQQSFIRATEKNPFVTDYTWVSSNGGRTCQLCASRDGEHYTAKDLPLDHPNGMCTWVANTVSEDEIINQLTGWVNGEENEALDEYAKSLGYDFSTKDTVKQPKVSTVFDKNAIDLSYKSNSPNKIYNDFSKWKESLTNNEKRGIKTYSRQSYKNINNFLRGINNNVGMYEKEMIEETSKALAKSITPEDIVVRRAVSRKGVAGLFDTDGIREIAKNKEDYIGKVVTEKGFTSASIVDLDKFKGEVEYVIHIPKGSKGVGYIGSAEGLGGEALGNSGEFEMLIDKGAKFIVKDIEGTKSSVKKIYLELLT